jgi:hypothetical protein
LKEKSERIEGVGFGEVEKGQGGMGKTTIFFLPPSRYRIERQGGRPVEGVGRRRPRPWGRPRCEALWMGLFVQAAVVAVGEETGRRGEVMVEVTVGRRLSEQWRGRGDAVRRGLAAGGRRGGKRKEKKKSKRRKRKKRKEKEK